MWTVIKGAFENTLQLRCFLLVLHESNLWTVLRFLQPNTHESVFITCKFGKRDRKLSLSLIVQAKAYLVLALVLNT